MRVAAVLLVVLSACQLIVGDDADDEDDYIDCNDLPVRALRDLRTGICTPVGRVGNERECKACGNCVPADLEVMGRTECGSSARCEHKPEFDCVHDSGCHTVYAAGDGHYLGCWGVAPMGVTSQGTCAGLDAYACSGRASCSAWYVARGAATVAFDHCGDAPPLTACKWAVCEPDKQCVQDCTPCDASGGASCDMSCQATCVSQGCDELACPLGNVCRETCVRWGPQYPPQCFASCQPFEVGSPGLCDGPITCAASPPACPAGTIAGRAAGCYTGFCIAVPQCPQLPCDALVTEPRCAARADCRVIDRGSDCSCAAAGCSCALRAFDRCEAAPAGSGG